jgi:hypothetical protein
MTNTSNMEEETHFTDIMNIKTTGEVKTENINVAVKWSVVGFQIDEVVVVLKKW